MVKTVENNSILRAHDWAPRSSRGPPLGTLMTLSHIPAAQGHSSVPAWHAGLEKNPQAPQRALPHPAVCTRIGHGARPRGSACCVSPCDSLK